MYERSCCEIPNAIATTASTATTRRTRTTKIFNENSEQQCKCQRNFQSRTHHSCNIVASSSNRKAIQANVNMQPLQRPQPQQQQQQQQQQHMQLQLQQQSANQLLHLQMPIESTPAFMENGLITPSEPAIANGCTSSPPSPLSTSSLSSSESSTTQATPSLGVNLRVTGQCSQGGRKYMEDYFSVAYQHSENAKDLEYAFFGIFDGHGGAEAATFAKEHLMMEIINQKLFWSDSDQDVLRAIREGYIATHFAMWRDQDKWPKTANGLPSTAGTTATVAFIRHEKIYIGHVGDSGIVLGYQNDGEKCWRAKQLTTDHKPESMAERSRIMRSGGKVIVKSGVPRVVWNRPRNAGHRGPIRHNTPIDEIPFLAVARSLGDLWSYNSLSNEFVVSPDPDVRVIKINPKAFRCLIFGTDGLWNVVTPQEAVNTVFHNETVNERLQRQRGENLSNENGWMNPSKVLVDRALGTWSAKKMRADNTSVVTVILHPPSNNGNSNNSGINNVSGASKLDSCLNDNFGLEYTHMSAAYVNSDETITYREMAEKYLPPEEYRNFNYYEDSVECSVMSDGNNKSYYDERYAKLSANGQRYSLPNTLEALEFMCGNSEQLDQIAVSNSKEADRATEATIEARDKLGAADDNDDTDEEDCDDDEDEVNEDEDGERTTAADDDVLGLNNYAPQYLRDQKVMSESTSTFGVGSVDETTTSSYMSTFAESYNTLLGGDSVVSDSHISADVSTSNSSSSYKSHSATCMQELVQEQQRYQQQCMSEEDGYSLTKLETRREQQRCSATGVQTFRIFQQQQQQQQQQHDNNDALANGQRTSSSSSSNTNCQQNYMWERRYPSAFAGSQRYQNYQQQQTQQQQFMLEQQLKSLELNSLLQQEREEEQQVEFERQMEMERFQQQQSLQSSPQIEHQSDDFRKSSIATSDFLLVHGNDNASSEVLKPISTSKGEEIDADDTIDEEYLLLDEDGDVDDPSVQINEISSSSSCPLESDVHTKALLKATSSFTKISSSPLLLSPLPSPTTSRETVFTDALGSTSDSSYDNCTAIIKESPKIIEKLENIEILHEKPELVIEGTPAPVCSIATRSKHKSNKATVIPLKRRSKSNVTTRLHFPNIPNENQHQLMQKAKSCHTSLKNGLLQLTPVATGEAQSFYSKRQLRSASNSSSNSSTNGVNNGVGSSSNCNVGVGNRKTCCHTSSSLNSNIDYVKRTLRTRNSLSKDLKAKTTLLSSGIKRSASAVTTRFLRTQAVNLLNIHQNPQVLGSNCKQPTSTTAMISPGCSPRRPQQSQRPLATTTFNFINLRSRQIGGSGSGTIAGFTEPRQQQTPTIATSPAKSLQIRNLTASNASSTTMNATPNYVRRNLRSLSSMRTCIKGKVTVSTTSAGLTNYCKSIRSQSVTALVTPPPPSPKHLNPTASTVTFAVTRARTANGIMSSSPSTNSLLTLNGTIGLHNNRKRVIRTTETSQESILTATRTQKRLRR